MAERRKLTRNTQESLIPAKAEKPAPSPEADFCNIYRPGTFDDILGHESISTSVKAVLDSRSKRCFVFTGPSGLGKTTFSRAIRNYVCGGNDLLMDYKEVDGPVYSSAEKARELVEWMRYKPMIAGGKKLICVDEAHALSGQAWQCLLKSAEEPPPYGYWIFCTTVSGKVPATIMTRGASYNLEPLDAKTLFVLLQIVNEEQKLNLDDDILDLIAHESDGSPRMALTNLDKCRTAEDRREAAVLLQGAYENPDLRELCLAMSKGGISWEKAMKVLGGLSNLDPEGIRWLLRFLQPQRG